MTESDFHKLLQETAEVFNNSNIRKVQGEKWGYSISATRILPDRPLILGFNWGVGKDENSFKRQLEMPRETFQDLINKKDLGSLSRIVPYLEKYLPEISLSDFGQSNYCFFRSKTEGQILEGDLELCKGLFQYFLAVSSPSMIISLSGRLRKYLLNPNIQTILKNIVESEPIKFGRRGREITYVAAKGLLENSGRNIPIYFLPHPNSPMTTGARHQAWKFCFERSRQ